MAKYKLKGKVPRVGASSWVAETAVLIGDVEVGEECYIGPGAVLRGDFGPVRVGDRSSVQENCSMHSRVGVSCTVGSDVTIGHGAVLHGCTVKDRTIIGMNATVTDNAVVGEDCIVAEGSVVRAGDKIPDRSLAAGAPAQVKGPLKDTQITFKDAGTKAYVELTKMYLNELEKVDD